MATVPGSTSGQMMFTQNETTAGERTWVFHMVLSATNADATGITLTATISKAGGAFAAVNAGTAITELTNGWYKIVHNAADLDTLGALGVRITGTGCDPLNVVHQVVALDHTIATVDPDSTGITAIQAGMATHADVTAIAVPSVTKTVALGTLSADGASSGVDCQRALAVTLTATGTFGSGTVQVQTCADPTATSPVWVAVAGATLTSNGSKTVTLPARAVRWSLSGSTSPSIVCTATVQYPA